MMNIPEQSVLERRHEETMIQVLAIISRYLNVMPEESKKMLLDEIEEYNRKVISELNKK